MKTITWQVQGKSATKAFADQFEYDDTGVEFLNANEFCSGLWRVMSAHLSEADAQSWAIPTWMELAVIGYTQGEVEIRKQGIEVIVRKA